MRTPQILIAACIAPLAQWPPIEAGAAEFQPSIGDLVHIPAGFFEIPNGRLELADSLEIAGSEMKQLEDHELVITPCSVDVNFGANETCVGNGGVEGPPTAVHFSIVP